MDESSIQSDTAAMPNYHGISVLRWFCIFAAWIATAGIALVLLLPNENLDHSNWHAFKQSVRLASPLVKLLIFGLYMSVASTFLPLNTGWVVSAVAMQDVAVTDSLWATVLLVAAVGAFTSTIANLNDYHIFTLLMRSKRIAKIRNNRSYAAAERWFARSPLGILLIFNILPIPVDFTRVLAATHRYPRIPFTAANLLGRFIRYVIIAFITYNLGEKGWVATLALLGLAIAIALAKYLSGKLKKVNEL